MRMSKLTVSMLSALVMAVIYDYVEKTTGIELRALLYTSAAVMMFGLYCGLMTSNKNIEKEEA